MDIKSEKFYLVWHPDNFFGNILHEDYQAALNRAEVLLNKHPDKTFWIMEAKSVITLGKAEVKELR